jgi:hypothetical protein
MLATYKITEDLSNKIQLDFRYILFGGIKIAKNI